MGVLQIEEKKSDCFVGNDIGRSSDLSCGLKMKDKRVSRLDPVDVKRDKFFSESDL